MKTGLSNHQSVCPKLLTFEPLVEFNEIWHGGNAIQGDLDAIIFNPIVSIILKLLRFKFVWRALLNLGLVCLCYMVTMASKFFYCSIFG
jgi:hypothetical protein